MSEKPFDCVQMKCDIQRKLLREEAGMSVEERNRRAEEIALADPVLGPWFRRVLAAQRPVLTVAEEAPSYQADHRRDGNTTPGKAHDTDRTDGADR